MFKKSKQRVYISMLKNEITDFVTNFKKRYNIFPWNKILRLSKSELRSSVKVSLRGNDYTVMSLVNEIKNKKKFLDNSLKSSYYNHYIFAFIKESKTCTNDNEYQKVYDAISKEFSAECEKIQSEFTFCVESLAAINKALKSTLDTDYQSKGVKNLNEFKKVEINRFFIKKYMPRTKLLKSVERGEYGYAWIDTDDDLVGYVMCNKNGWITAVEITGEYRGYGLSRQLMTYAIKHMNGNKLGVHKDNKIALNLYRQLGFRIVPSEQIGGSKEKDMIFMLLAGTKNDNSNSKPLDNEIKESEDQTMSAFDANAYLESLENEIEMAKSNPENRKLALYEACDRGEITIEEREELLKDIFESEYIENTDEILHDDRYSMTQKFDKVRAILYEKCNNGEITVEARESLINKAREMIFSEGEVLNTAKDMGTEAAKSAANVTKEINKSMAAKGQQIKDLKNVATESSETEVLDETELSIDDIKCIDEL